MLDVNKIYCGDAKNYTQNGKVNIFKYNDTTATSIGTMNVRVNPGNIIILR